MKHYRFSNIWAEWLLVALLLVLCFVMTGCVAKEKPNDFVQVSPDFFGFSEQLAEQLVKNKRTKGVKDERLILTTFVNLDDLYQTSSFGRAMAEALANSLFQRGFRIAEIRKSPGLYIKSKSGELTLTRDISIITRQQEVHGIVAGTYSLTPTTVVVSVRLLAAGSEEVLSVAGLEIERGSNINYLLSDRKKGPVIGPLSAYER